MDELQRQIRNFCQERDWDQFHGAKDLAVGLITEAAELLELFRFKDQKEINELMVSENFREKVSDELADVLFFLLRFADMNKFDLSDCLQNKIKKSAIKYPVEKARGSNRKYTEL